MLTALLVGLVVGFVLAVPPGSIALACVRQAITGQERAGVALVLAASAMDIGFALLAAWASSSLFGVLRDIVLQHAWLQLLFQGGCIAVLVVLGLRSCFPSMFRNAARARQEVRGRSHGGSSPFLSGILLALTNLASPTFLPALIFAMHLLHGQGWVGDTLGENVVYALGFGTGSALWFVLLLRTLTYFRAQFSPTVLQLMDRVAGGMFLLFAALLSYNVVTTAVWAHVPGW